MITLKGRNTELVAIVWIMVILVSVLVANYLVDFEKSESWPTHESAIIQYQDGIMNQNASHIFEISVAQKPDNTTYIETVVEFPVNVTMWSNRVIFGMNNTYITWGDNYAVNETKVAIFASPFETQSWQSDFEESRGFGALSLEFEGEYLLNDSNRVDHYFRLVWNSNLALENFSEDTTDFSILIDFSFDLVDLYPFNVPLSESYLWIGVIATEGILGLILLIIVKNEII